MPRDKTQTGNRFPSIRLGFSVGGVTAVNAKLAELSNAIRRRINRAAVKAAARPLLIAAKNAANIVAHTSKRHEGFGTTARAMSLKTGSVKANPDIAYAVIGADRNYVELLDLQNALKRSRVMNVRFQKRGKGGVMKAPQRLAGQKKLALHARSSVTPQKNEYGLKTGGAVRRKPAKYAHLIEYGTRRSAAYPILARVRALRATALASFENEFSIRLYKEVQRLASKRAA